VSVRGGKVTKVVYEDQNGGGYWPGRVVSKKEYDDTYLISTIEDVFVRAEKLINSSDGPDAAIPKAPHKIHYDPEYGFPTLIDVDNPPHIADAQWRLVVDKFRPVKR
jgi:hypothetical protein